MEVIYEDNHIIAVNKTCREIVQGDKTGDTPLSDMLKAWLKEKYCKPGNVFVGVTHRLDRPVSGVVLFAKTSKALARLNEMFRVGEVKKTYWAIVKNCPPAEEGELVFRNGTLKANFFRDIWRVEKIRKNFDIRETELIQGILEAGVKEGIFAMPDTEITAVVLHHALKGLEVPYIRGIMGDNISQRIKRRDNVMNLIFNGIKIK
jgi:16S rRNA U516 pseudouridylate synthase RsuA-like enzyme